MLRMFHIHQVQDQDVYGRERGVVSKSRPEGGLPSQDVLPRCTSTPCGMLVIYLVCGSSGGPVVSWVGFCGMSLGHGEGQQII